MGENEGVRFDEVVTVRRIVIAGALLVVMSLVALGVSTTGDVTPPDWQEEAPTDAAESLVQMPSSQIAAWTREVPSKGDLARQLRME